MSLVFTLFIVNIARVFVGELSLRTHQVLSVPKRAELLELLRRTDKTLDVADAAHEVGLHINTTRIHLDQLVQVGLATRITKKPSGPGRPKSLYRATPDKELTPSPHPTGPVDDRAYKSLATVLAEGLGATPDPAAAALAAGQRWVKAVVATDWSGPRDSPEAVGDALSGLMGDLGFDPELDLDLDLIRLHTCPFAEVARHNRRVVCNVHLGMVQATLDRLGGPLKAVGIEPFVQDEPLLCHVHLSKSAQDGSTKDNSRSRSDG